MGRCEEGEEIHQAALREVKEETGLDCEILDLLFFRELLGSMWGKCDLFFGFLVAPKSSAVVISSEISSFKWIHLKQLQSFMANNLVTKPTNLYLLELLAKLNGYGYDVKKLKQFDIQYGLFRQRKYNIFQPIRCAEGLLNREK